MADTCSSPRTDEDRGERHPEGMRDREVVCAGGGLLLLLLLPMNSQKGKEVHSFYCDL